MLLFYYTHSIVFWLGLPHFKPNQDLTKNLLNSDLEYLPREVCMAQCLKWRKEQISAVMEVDQMDLNNITSLQICRDNCIASNATYKTGSKNISTVKQIHENYGLNLICRDESSLHFLIDMHTMKISEKHNSSEMTDTIESSYVSNASLENLSSFVSSSTPSSPSSLSYKNYSNTNESDEYETLFVIKINLANHAEEFFAYLSDDNFFTIDKLMPNTTYNISVMAVHSNNKYSVIAQQQQFQTLRRSFTPGNVTEIKITNFTEDKLNKMHLTATMSWKPPADMTCHYDIICFSPEREDYDLPPLEIRNPRQLYKYQLENLTFSSLYKVGIRARNTKNMQESELFWKTFQAPSCVEWYNYNFSICAPDAPQNLNVEQTYVEQNVYSLNITWLLPSHLPDNYTLRVQDLSPQGKLEIYNLTKEIHNLFLPHVTIYGVFYEVSLTAYTKGGQTTSSFTDFTKTIVHLPEKNPFVKLIAVILAPIFCVAILLLTTFMIYHRRAKLKRYQERCKYFEELEKKAPIDPKDNFDFDPNNKHKLEELQYQLDLDDMTLFNDEMEIDRDQLTLHEVLGEGAFGLVKRGIYKDVKFENTQEVAVKMLKDHPSADDVRAFRREIEVMKSVEKHPNIVGIIGHCTRYGKEMMLLTEYCSFGNLLNFLRDEWRFLHELQQRKQTLTTKIVDVELPQVSPEQRNNELKHQHVQFKYDNNHKISTSPHHFIKSGVGTHSTKLNQFKITDEIKRNYGNNKEILGIDELERDKEDVIENFKKKYTDFSNVTTATEEITNYVNNNNGSNLKVYKSKENLIQHMEKLNSTVTSPTNTTASYHSTLNDMTILTHISNDQQQMIRTSTSTATCALSPATENKSYGYHGCCTNSCKCDVDVIIRNIDSSDSGQDNEELERLLQRQQQQQQQQHNHHHHLEQQKQFPDNQKSTKSCCTTIEIKNCTCKMKEANFQNHQPLNEDNNTRNSAVENKTYFKIFNSDNYVQRKPHFKDAQLPPPAAKVKRKIKPPPLPPLSITNSENDMWAATFNRVPLSSGDLFDIAKQVAVGMDFLSKNKVVHRDLAARNVLVAPDRTVKIADFGLSRDVYQENMYKKTGNGKLPIKWLALESMTHQVYTTQSDVWSYGILLYEIVTLGATPYPSIPTNRLLHLLKTGYRMEKPKNCGQDFYDLMYSCWNSVPNERPTFNEIIKKLDEMLNNFNARTNTTTTIITDARDYIKKDNDLTKQESPIQQQMCSDDSYLKPL